MLKRKKNLILRIIYNQKFLALVGLVLIILISIPLAKNISKRYEIDQEIKGLEKEINELNVNNNDLKKLITYLESDQFVEEQARLNLGLKKEGENVIIIKGNSQAGSINNNTALDDDKNISNLKRWWNYFFK